MNVGVKRSNASEREWVVADVPFFGWLIIDALRLAQGETSRSAVAEAAVWQALVGDGPVTP